LELDTGVNTIENEVEKVITLLYRLNIVGAGQAVRGATA